MEVLWTTGGVLDNWRYSRQLEVLWTTGGALDKWRCSRQLEVLSTTVGTLDNWKCSGEPLVLQTNGSSLSSEFIEPLVLQTNGSAFDSCWYSGQLEILSMTGDLMMLCDHKVQSNPASVRSKFLGGEGVVDGEGGSSEGCLKWGGGGWGVGGH